MDWIRKEVERIIAEARANDEQDAESSADDMPEDLVEPDSRLERLLAAKARLEEEAARRQADYEAKLAAREEHKARTGKGMVGRKPKPPGERQEDRVRSKTANTTDPESRVMSSANGGYLQGYTGQAIATEEQITIACALTNEATDFKQLGPMVEQAAGNLAAAGVGESIGIVTAAAGYLSDANLALQDEFGIELIVATRTTKAAEMRRHGARGRTPKALTRTQLMERKLRTSGEIASTANEQPRSNRSSDNSDNAAWDGSGGAN